MRRIAGALDVQPGALYYHVPNKQELLRLVAHRVLGPLNRAEASPRILMSEFRGTLLRLRDGGDLALIAYSLDPDLPPVGALCAGLAQQGLSPESAQQRSGILMRYALGAIAVEQNAQLFDHGHSAEPATVYAEGLRLLLEG